MLKSNMFKKIIAILLVLTTATLFAYSLYGIEYKRYKKVCDVGDSVKIVIFERSSYGISFYNGITPNDDAVKLINRLLNSCEKSENQLYLQPPIEQGSMGRQTNESVEKPLEFVLNWGDNEDFYPVVAFYDCNDVIFTGKNGFPVGRYTSSKRLYEEVVELIAKFEYDKINGAYDEYLG